MHYEWGPCRPCKIHPSFILFNWFKTATSDRWVKVAPTTRSAPQKKQKIARTYLRTLRAYCIQNATFSVEHSPNLVATSYPLIPPGRGTDGGGCRQQMAVSRNTPLHKASRVIARPFHPPFCRPYCRGLGAVLSCFEIKPNRQTMGSQLLISHYRIAHFS